MAERRDYYLDQQVTSEELNEGFDGLENADRALASDLGFFGVIAQGVVVQHSALANLTVDVSGGGIIYDQIGERIFWPNVQTVNLAVDSNQVTTAVSASPNEKWVSLFAQFTRVLSDPRVDGNSDTIYFDQAEGFQFFVSQAAEAAIGTAPRPSMQSAMVLLADVNMRYAETAILNASIDITRRQDWVVINGSPLSIRRGRIADALGDIVAAYNGLIGGSNSLPATQITYAGTSAWADGTTNPATTVEGQLDHIVAALAGSTGTAKIEAPAYAGTNFTMASGTLASQLLQMNEKIDETMLRFSLIQTYRIAPAAVVVPGGALTSLMTWTGVTAFSSSHEYNWNPIAVGVTPTYAQIQDVFVIRARLQMSLGTSDVCYGQLLFSVNGGSLQNFPENNPSFQQTETSTGGYFKATLEGKVQLGSGMGITYPATTFGLTLQAATLGGSTVLNLFNTSDITVEHWRFLS